MASTIEKMLNYPEWDVVKITCGCPSFIFSDSIHKFGLSEDKRFKFHTEIEYTYHLVDNYRKRGLFRIFNTIPKVQGQVFQFFECEVFKFLIFGLRRRYAL